MSDFELLEGLLRQQQFKIVDLEKRLIRLEEELKVLRARVSRRREKKRLLRPRSR